MDALQTKAINLAIGRIFRIASRAERPGDVAEYARCRTFILDHTEIVATDYAHNYARDRLKGAQGD